MKDKLKLQIELYNSEENCFGNYLKEDANEEEFCTHLVRHVINSTHCLSKTFKHLTSKQKGRVYRIASNILAKRAHHFENKAYEEEDE